MEHLAGGYSCLYPWQYVYEDRICVGSIKCTQVSHQDLASHAITECCLTLALKKLNLGKGKKGVYYFSLIEKSSIKLG